MNLIEKLGLEKCKQIVDGAPEDATDYEVLFNNINYMQQHNGKWYWFSDVAKEWYLDCMDDLERFSLADLRTTLADHDRIDTCSDIRNHISPNTKVIEHE